MRKLLLLLLLLCLQSCPVAGADEVCLENGNVIKGIIIREDESILEIEVFLDARITFTMQDISYVKKWNRQQNIQLRQQWLKDREERKKAELKRQQFEAEQKSKGLVKYRGEWIPKAEQEKLSTMEYINQVLAAKIDRGEIPRSGSRGRSAIARSLLSQGTWKNRQTEHFIVYYEDLMQSKIVADRAEYYYEKIAYDLDYERKIYWPQKCEVFIIDGKEKWREYMQQHLRRFDHVGGFVPATSEKEIYLCALSLPYLSVTFPHELTHLIFREFAQGEPIPLWLNEGLAIYESGLIGYADELLRNKVKEAAHIPLKQFVKMNNYPATREEVELFYAQSEKIVEFLITQYGRKSFSQLCRMLISDKSFEQALRTAYADKYQNFDQFKRDWIKYVLR